MQLVVKNAKKISVFLSNQMTNNFLKTLQTLDSDVVSKYSANIQMSTKVAKVSKTSTKTAPAKAVSKVTNTVSKVEIVKSTKSPTLRLSEDDKKTDSVNYITNPNTGKFVKRDTPLGKKLAKAEETGEEIPKTMTETERIILVVQTLQDQLDLEDSAIKTSLKPIMEELPRGFPVIWGGKQKTARSPDHPIQPNNAYIFFTKAVRQSTAEANPTLKNTEIVSLMAKMWKNTADEDRSEYNDLAAEDKERYETEMKVFETEHPDQARAKSSPGKPTKVTAYHKYCKDNRDTFKEKNSTLNDKAITRLLADKWKEDQKDEEILAKYQALADEANEGFEDRVIDYHENNGHKKLSETEQKKANDPDNYELNPKTGRFVEKEKLKKVASPKVEKTEKPEKTEKSEKKAITKSAPVPVPVSKSISKRSKAKTVAEGVVNDEVEIIDDDEDDDEEDKVEEDKVEEDKVEDKDKDKEEDKEDEFMVV